MKREIKALETLRSDETTLHARLQPRPPASDEKSLAQVLATIFQARILIGAITLGFLALGGTYVFLASPVFRSDLLIQVEDTNRSIAGLSEISAVLNDRSASETEMEIVRSRGSIGSVVDQLNLQITAAPRYFPLIGGAIARRYRGSGPASAPLAQLASYAWGGERIDVERLTVPDDLLDVPLTLVTRTDGKYELLGDGEFLLSGIVGMPATGSYRGAPVQMFVSDIVARPGTRFTVMKRRRLRVIEGLQESLRISEKGRKTGILLVALDGPEPARTAAILDAVAATYLRQNVERRSAEAAKTLEFLESQLPALKANLDAAEAAFKAYQLKKGTVDLSRESQAMLARVVEIERSLSEAELQRSDLRQRFTGSHPALVSLDEKIEKLRAQRAAINGKMRNLPDTELDSARLTRDVKVAGELYNVLLNKAQELRVVKSGTIGNVRILDPASVSDIPVKPMRSIIALGCVLLGLIAGTGTAFARKSFYVGVDDPDEIESLIGIPVYATIPRSERQASLPAAVSKRTPQALLAEVEPGDAAVEAIRSLRTGLQFGLLEARNNVVLITGPVADVGKSFVTVNLGYVLASAGRRVLIVDGDLRRGHIHKFFGGERHPGLSDVLTGSESVAHAVSKSSLETLHWLPTGRIPPNSAELLLTDRFEHVLTDVSSVYDIVLIDSPPVLPVTDAVVLGRFAGTTLLVLRAGAHPAGEVVSAVKRLNQNGVAVRGAVLNDVSGAGARFSKYRYQYQYRYEPRS